MPPFFGRRVIAAVVLLVAGCTAASVDLAFATDGSPACTSKLSALQKGVRWALTAANSTDVMTVVPYNPTMAGALLPASAIAAVDVCEAASASTIADSSSRGIPVFTIAEVNTTATPAPTLVRLAPDPDVIAAAVFRQIREHAGWTDAPCVWPAASHGSMTPYMLRVLAGVTSRGLCSRYVDSDSATEFAAYIAGLKQGSTQLVTFALCNASCVTSLARAIATEGLADTHELMTVPQLTNLDDVQSALSSTPELHDVVHITASTPLPSPQAFSTNATFRGALDRQHPNFSTALGFATGAMIASSFHRFGQSGFARSVRNSVKLPLEPSGAAALGPLGGPCQDAPSTLYVWELHPKRAAPNGTGWEGAESSVTSTPDFFLNIKRRPCDAVPTVAEQDAATPPLLLHVQIDDPVGRVWSERFLAALSASHGRVRLFTATTVNERGVATASRNLAQRYPDARAFAGQIITPETVYLNSLAPLPAPFVCALGRQSLSFTRATATSEIADVRTERHVLDFLPPIDAQVIAFGRAAAARVIACAGRCRAFVLVSPDPSQAYAASRVIASAHREIDAFENATAAMKANVVRVDIQWNITEALFAVAGAPPTNSSNLPGYLIVMLPAAYAAQFRTFVGGLGAARAAGLAHIDLMVSIADYPYAVAAVPASVQHNVHTVTVPEFGDTFADMVGRCAAFAVKAASMAAPRRLEPTAVAAVLDRGTVDLDLAGGTQTVGVFSAVPQCAIGVPSMKVDEYVTPFDHCVPVEAADDAHAEHDDAHGTGVPLYAWVLVGVAAMLLVALVAVIVLCFVRNGPGSSRRNSTGRRGSGGRGSRDDDDDEEDPDLAGSVGGGPDHSAHNDDDEEDEPAEKASSKQKSESEGDVQSTLSGSASKPRSEVTVGSSSRDRAAAPGSSSHGKSTVSSQSKIMSLQNSKSLGGNTLMGHLTAASAAGSGYTHGSGSDDTDELPNQELHDDLVRPIVVESRSFAGVTSTTGVLISLFLVCAICLAGAALTFVDFDAVVPFNANAANRVDLVADIMGCASHAVTEGSIAPIAAVSVPVSGVTVYHRLLVNFYANRPTRWSMCEDAGVAVSDALSTANTGASAAALQSAIGAMPQLLTHRGVILTHAVEGAIDAWAALAHAVADEAGPARAAATTMASVAHARIYMYLAWATVTNTRVFAFPSSNADLDIAISYFSTARSLLLNSGAADDGIDAATLGLNRLDQLISRRFSLTLDCGVECPGTVDYLNEIVGIYAARARNAADDQYDVRVWGPVVTFSVVIAGLGLVAALYLLQQHAERAVNEELAQTEEDREVTSMLVPTVQLCQAGHDTIVTAVRDSATERKLAIFMHEFRPNRATLFASAVDQEHNFVADHADVVAQLLEQLGSSLDRVICGDAMTIAFDNPDDAAKFSLELIVRIRRANIRRDASTASRITGRGGINGPSIVLNDDNNDRESQQSGSAASVGVARGVGDQDDQHDVLVSCALGYGSVRCGVVDVRQQYILTRVGPIVDDVRALLSFAKRCRGTFFITDEARDALQITNLEMRPLGHVPEHFAAHSVHLTAWDVFQTESVEVKAQRRSSRRMLERFFKGDAGARLRYLREAVRGAEVANIDDPTLCFIYAQAKRNADMNDTSMMERSGNNNNNNASSSSFDRNMSETMPPPGSPGSPNGTLGAPATPSRRMASFLNNNEDAQTPGAASVDTMLPISSARNPPGSGEFAGLARVDSHTFAIPEMSVAAPPDAQRAALVRAQQATTMPAVAEQGNDAEDEMAALAMPPGAIADAPTADRRGTLNTSAGDPALLERTVCPEDVGAGVGIAVSAPTPQMRPVEGPMILANDAAGGALPGAVDSVESTPAAAAGLPTPHEPARQMPAAAAGEDSMNAPPQDPHNSSLKSPMGFSSRKPSMVESLAAPSTVATDDTMSGTSSISRKSRSKDKGEKREKKDKGDKKSKKDKKDKSGSSMRKDKEKDKPPSS